MNAMAHVVWFSIRDAVRGRAVLGYALFILLATDVLLRFSGGGAQAMLSLVNVVLLLVPLVSVLLGTMHVHAAREFTELLLAQPVRRRAVFAGLYVGLAVPLSLAAALGLAIPFAVHGTSGPAEQRALASLIVMAVALTWVFVGIAQAVAIRWDDRVRALGTSLALWLVLALLYDGIVLVLVTMFAAYPIERAVLGVVLANPIDLARIVLLLQLDVSALMGYTGAVFRDFLGGPAGAVTAAAALLGWIAVPVAIGARIFRRKDF